MYEADVIRSFTWGKRNDHNFRAGKVISDLEKEDVEYLEKNGVIANVRKQGEVPEKAEVVVETEEIKAKPEKAVKKTTKKKNATNK